MFGAVLHWLWLQSEPSHERLLAQTLTGWFKVTPDELMAMLGGALKAGVPMEENLLQSGTPETGFHK